jgi:hypothetical protein
MLEPFGLIVHLIPAVAQGLDQVTLQEAMVTHYFQGNLLASAGQTDVTVALVLDQIELAEARDHVGDGRRPDTKPLRETMNRRATQLGFLSAELVDGFEVVLHGRRDPRFIARDRKGCIHAATSCPNQRRLIGLLRAPDDAAYLHDHLQDSAADAGLPGCAQRQVAYPRRRLSYRH